MGGYLAIDQQAKQVYDQEYFSGTQASIYIGDIWVDEITSFIYTAQQNKTPLYGYASQLFDAVTRGPKLVRGSFTVNFKEAGYLFLVLERYADKKGTRTPFRGSGGKHHLKRLNIERAYNLPDGDGAVVRGPRGTRVNRYKMYHDLAGWASEVQAAPGKKQGLDKAEGYFENFENRIWKDSQQQLDTMRRSADDHRLNGFDIYLQFGDWSTDLANHTIVKLANVHIIESSIQVSANGQPVQESYSFLARNKV